MILEDCVLVATRDNNTAKGGEEIVGCWHVLASDILTGVSHTAEWSDKQLAAILALSHGLGEDMPDLAGPLYMIAEPALIGFPKECRPIP